MKIQGFILYRFYYDDEIVYIGRTKQPLQDRIRGHLFKKPMHRSIDIAHVTKIEYAKFKTEADMNLYEIYYINKVKPPLNVDDKTKDELTVTLPHVEFITFEPKLWDKWKSQIESKNGTHEQKYQRLYSLDEERRILRSKHNMNEITEDEYYQEREKLAKEESELRMFIYGRKN